MKMLHVPMINLQSTPKYQISFFHFDNGTLCQHDQGHFIVIGGCDAPLLPTWDSAKDQAQTLRPSNE